jgi:hypothetical protein
MCKMNIAACDKGTPPHRSTLHCWPLLLEYPIISVKTEQSWAKHVCDFRLTGYADEA